MNFKQSIHVFFPEILSSHNFPRVLVLEPTNSCDMKCIFCLSAKFKYRPVNMSLRLFKNIIRQSSSHGLREAIVFSGIGEPLLHPEIIYMLKAAKKIAHQVHINTNGFSLNEFLADELIKLDLGSIAVGLDGARKETYEAIRVGSSFERVVTNIKTLVSCKAKRKAGTKIIIRVASIPENKNEIAQIRKDWSGYVDSVEVISQHKARASRKRFPCFSLWSHMAINSSGRVYACGFEYDRKRVFSDITKDSMQNIWEKGFLKDFRDIHLSGDFDKLNTCKSCRHWHANNFIELS